MTIAVGQKFGRWTTVELRRGSRTMEWACACACGNTASLEPSALLSGKSRSCGCLRRDVSRAKSRRHGHTVGRAPTRTYGTWQKMKARCLNAECPDFVRYGGRGITVCERWLDFEHFLADMGECPPRLTIDRVNNDGNYEPKNCRWATRTEQNRNKRTTKLTLPLAASAFTLSRDGVIQRKIAAQLGVTQAMVHRILSGRAWPEARAFAAINPQGESA